MSDPTVAQEIIEQLGGLGALQLMVGANTFLYEDDSVMFAFKGSRKANKCKVTLEWTDTYRVEFYKIGRNFNHTTPFDESGIYNEDLKKIFEDFTGLILTVPRIVRRK